MYNTFLHIIYKKYFVRRKIESAASFGGLAVLFSSYDYFCCRKVSNYLFKTGTKHTLKLTNEYLFPSKTKRSSTHTLMCNTVKRHKQLSGEDYKYKLQSNGQSCSNRWYTYLIIYFYNYKILFKKNLSQKMRGEANTHTHRCTDYTHFKTYDAGAFFLGILVKRRKVFHAKKMAMILLLV